MNERAATGDATYSSAIRDASNYTRWILSAFDGKIGRQVLEVGIGHGGHADHLPPGVEYVGLDIDEGSVEAARSQHPERSYVCADVLDPALPELVAARVFDTVLCVNVLEHVDRDADAVANLLTVLAPGGRLLIFVPAFQALYSDLDRMAGHVRRYTTGALAALVPPGAVIEMNEYFNPIGGLGWWANKFLPHRTLNDGAVNGQVKLFDRYILPLSRAVNPITRSFFGQSIVCVVRKA